MTHSIQFTWGDALVVKVHRTRIGLQAYVNAIQEIVGKNIGSRPTFAKLYDANDADDLDATEGFRAWLLLTAMGENPDDWGVAEAVVPRGWNVRHLQRELRRVVRHQGLEPRTRWFDRTAERRGLKLAPVPDEPRPNRAAVIPLATAADHPPMAVEHTAAYLAQAA